MFAGVMDKLSDLPAIVQGAAGSALFWIILKALEFIWPRVLRLVGSAAGLEQERKIREYIYRRYTGMSGLVNYAQGYLFTFSRAFRGLLMGLLFCCVALLLGGSLPVIWGVCFTAAIVYFASALTWLMPSSRWSAADPSAHWQRIAELEKELMGKVDPETQERIDQLAKPRADEARDPNNPSKVI